MDDRRQSTLRTARGRLGRRPGRAGQLPSSSRTRRSAPGCRACAAGRAQRRRSCWAAGWPTCAPPGSATQRSPSQRSCRCGLAQRTSACSRWFGGCISRTCAALSSEHHGCSQQGRALAKQCFLTVPRACLFGTAELLHCPLLPVRNICRSPGHGANALNQSRSGMKRMCGQRQDSWAGKASRGMLVCACAGPGAHRADRGDAGPAGGRLGRAGRAAQAGHARVQRRHLSVCARWTPARGPGCAHRHGGGLLEVQGVFLRF